METKFTEQIAKTDKELAKKHVLETVVKYKFLEFREVHRGTIRYFWLAK